MDDGDNKYTIRDGGSTAPYAAYTVDMVFTVDTVYTVDMVFTVYRACTADMIYTVDIVYTVDNVQDWEVGLQTVTTVTDMALLALWELTSRCTLMH